MGIDIWLAIIINCVILGILIGGILIGKKNGFVYELIKLLIILGSGVGLYFITPLISNLCLNISFIKALIEQNLLTAQLLHALTFTLLFIVCYCIITVIFAIVKHIKTKNTKITVTSTKDRKYVNTAQVAKVSGVNKKETRKLQKEQKKYLKERKKQEKELININKKKLTKTQKAFGIIVGIIISLIIGFVMIMPIKIILKNVAESQPSISQITKSYDYTIYGQLDNITGIVDFINKTGE